MTETLPAEPAPEALPIVVLLSRVMADVGAIPKTHDHDAPGARFKFRGIEDVQAALQPALRRHGVIVAPFVQERRDLPSRPKSNGGSMTAVALHVSYTFHGPAGDLLTVSAWGEGADSSDKATGKAMSMAFKSAMLQTFVIPTEDQPDADRYEPEGRPPAESPEQAAERDDLAQRAIAAAAAAPTPEKLQDVGAYAHRQGVLDRTVQVSGVDWSPRRACDRRRAELEEQAGPEQQELGHPSEHYGDGEG